MRLRLHFTKILFIILIIFLAFIMPNWVRLSIFGAFLFQTGLYLYND